MPDTPKGARLGPKPRQLDHDRYARIFELGKEADPSQIPQADGEAGSDDHLVGIINEITQLFLMEPPLNRIWKLTPDHAP